MMRAALLAALAACRGTQVAAQEAEPAFSAEEDLDCAIYVGALMAAMGADLTPENRIGLTSAPTYFVGRYEAQRGTDLTRAFLERYPIYQQRNPAQIEQTFSVRMRAFSRRFQLSGSALDRTQRSAAEPGIEPDR